MDFKDIAQKANEVEDELSLTLDDVLNKITQEFGELNDAIQKFRGRYCKKRIETTTNVEEELGDVLMNLVSIAYRLGIDPNKFPQYAQATLEKFYERKELYKKSQR